MISFIQSPDSLYDSLRELSSSKGKRITALMVEELPGKIKAGLGRVVIAGNDQKLMEIEKKDRSKGVLSDLVIYRSFL